ERSRWSAEADRSCRTSGRCQERGGLRTVAIGWTSKSSKALATTRLVDLAVDARDLAKPDVTFFVFHVEDVVGRPVKVVRDVSNLLVQLLSRIGSDRRPGHPGPDWPLPPSAVMSAPVTMSTSISCWHFGHWMWCFGAPPSSLILR